MPVGYSFQPGADQQMAGGQGQGGRSVAPPSSSVKVLSFRMPKQDIRGAVAPAALLNAQGSAGATGGLSPQLLALLMQAFSASPQSRGNVFDDPTASSDPAGVVGPGPSFGAPKFTIGEGQGPFRGGDLGPAIAAANPFGGGEMPFGGLTTGQTFGGSRRGTEAPTSGISPGPRFKMPIDDSLSLPFGQPFDADSLGRMYF